MNINSSTSSIINYSTRTEIISYMIALTTKVKPKNLVSASPARSSLRSCTFMLIAQIVNCPCYLNRVFLSNFGGKVYFVYLVIATVSIIPSCGFKTLYFSIYLLCLCTTKQTDQFYCCTVSSLKIFIVKFRKKTMVVHSSVP